jgi:tyrosinase
MPFDIWRSKRAEAADSMTRYSTASPRGAEMLKVYEAAVGRMKALPASDPRSWTFQWYTHWVDGDTTKEAALKAVFGDSPSANRDLAVAMWDTCQGHGPNPVKYFVVWHRMFVLYFEEIIRSVSGNASFTLPYWPYDQRDQRAIPEAFRGNPASPLYVANRNRGINEGQSIEDGRAPLNFECMGDPTFLQDPNGVNPGFNSNLNQNPHGVVHDNVGTGTNMGRIPYAAQDPIFYMHHCEVDRLWSSWNAAGGQNRADEDWMSQSFIFADGQGNRVIATNRDFLDTETLGYKYDTLMTVPPIRTPSPMVMAKAGEKAVILSVGAMDKVEKQGNGGNMLHGDIKGALELGDKPLSVDIPQPKTMSLMGAVNKGLTAKEGQVFLVLRDIYAVDFTGSSFGVYINLPEGADPVPSSPHYVGSINFFNATAMPGSDGMLMTDTFVLNVTEELKALRDAGSLGEGMRVTVAPFGKVNPGSAPKVGRIELVVE